MTFTYAEVGAARTDGLPGGYSHLMHRAPIGQGERTWRAAADAVLSWRMHEAVPVRVTASAPRAAPGVTVTVGLGVGALRISAPCAVVWAAEPDACDDGVAGFVYGTLAGHPERGEEAFLVTLDADERVWLTVRAFSRPASWYTRLAGPVVPVLQRAYARRCSAVLKRWCGR